MHEASRSDELKRTRNQFFQQVDPALYAQIVREKNSQRGGFPTPEQTIRLGALDQKLLCKAVDQLREELVTEKRARAAEKASRASEVAQLKLEFSQYQKRATASFAYQKQQHNKELLQRDAQAQARLDEKDVALREAVSALRKAEHKFDEAESREREAETFNQQLRTMIESQQSQLDTLTKAQSHFPQFLQALQTMAVAMGPMMADMGVAKDVPPLASVPVASPQKEALAMPPTSLVPVAAPPPAPKAPPPMPPSCATTSTTRDRDAPCDEPPSKKRRRRRAFEWVDLVAVLLCPADTVQQQQLAQQLLFLVRTAPDGTKVSAEARATAFATLVCGSPAHKQYDAMVHTWRTLLTSTEAPKAQVGSFAQRVYHVCDDEGVGQGVTKGTEQARNRIWKWLMTTRNDTAFIRAMTCLMQC